MATFGQNRNADFLRAIGHARMLIVAGRGVEAVVHALVHADLGAVSEDLGAPLADMQAGQSAEDALDAALRASTDTTWRGFLGCLLLEGDAAIVRLEELGEDIQARLTEQANEFSARLTLLLDLTAVLFILTYLPLIVSILEQIPENAVLPTLHLPDAFFWVYHVFLGVALVILVVLMRVRD